MNNIFTFSIYLLHNSKYRQKITINYVLYIAISMLEIGESCLETDQKVMFLLTNDVIMGSQKTNLFNQF